MPAERVSMRQIGEVLRLRFASELPQRAIAKSLGLSQGAVSGYLSRARAAGVSWRLAADLDDVQLEALLFPPPPAIADKAMTSAIDTTAIINPYSTICAPSSSRPKSTARLLIATNRLLMFN